MGRGDGWMGGRTGWDKQQNLAKTFDTMGQKYSEIYCDCNATSVDNSVSQ